jgi:hypothetical protein
MLAQGWLDQGQKIRYGGGLMFQRYRGLDMLRHDGFSSGSRAEFCRFPQKEAAIICLSNITSVSPTWIARQVADAIWGREMESVSALGPGQPPPPMAVAKLPAKRLRELEGIYRAEGGGAFAELNAGQEGLRLSGMFMHADLAAESAQAFQGTGSSKIYRLDFDGPESFILTKQGRAQRYARQDPKKEPAPAALERLLGRYACPEIPSRMEVKLVDDKLCLCDAAGIEWPLKPLKGGRFYNYFREISFSKKGMLMEGTDHWVRRLKWVRL